MIYELRRYEVADGRMNELHERFEKHTIRLFEKFGIKPVAFWISVDENEKNFLTYLLKFESVEAQREAWDKFMKDEERIEIWKKSNENGKLVIDIVSKTLKPTDYSPLQ